MIFVKKAMAAKEAEFSLIKKLDSRLSGWEAARDHKVIHISDLSKDKGFCPREFALLDVNKKPAKGQYISTALRVTFDNGNALSDLCRNKWLVEDIVGNWKCPVCKGLIKFSKRPKVKCKTCQADLWQYEEVSIKDKHGRSGSIDFFVDLGLDKHLAVECKTMDKDMFNDLKAPLAEHKVRTQLYLLHMASSGWEHADKVNLQQGIVLYISKAFGKKNDATGRVTPFKEFIVDRSDKDVMELYKRGEMVAAFRSGGKMPKGICANSMDRRAKSCSVIKECFSGSFPAGV